MSENQQYGCFACPLEPKDAKLTPLPLTKIAYNIEIINGIAEVSLNQTYINKGATFLELQYKFPISPNSCIYKFVAIFSKARMEGVVKEKEEAIIEYNEAIKMGKKAAFGQKDAQSKDILILQIGNLGPGQQVKIEIVYTQELTISLNTFYQFNLITRHTPRYVNTLPPEDYFNSFRKSAKTVGGDFEWDFNVRIRTARKVIQCKSVSHPLFLEKFNDSKTDLQFTIGQGGKQSIFSKAFSLMFTTEHFQVPSFVLGRSDAGSSVLVSFIPKFCSLSIDDARIAAEQGKYLQTEIDDAKGEYIFILDRSGSMSGQPIEKAKEALILFLKSLPIDTYFQVISFGSGSQKLFPTSQKNGNESIANAILSISQMSADMGGTQIYQPLNIIFSQQVIQGYARQIFLLTDGGVSDTQEVIKLVRKNIKYSRVHAIGIGNGVSQALIIGCAQKGKGQHIFIKDQEDPSEKIIQLLNDSLTPVISKVVVQYDKDIVQSIVPNPEKIPYILKGDIANFYLTFKGHLSKPTTVSLSYIDPLTNLPYSSKIQVFPDSTTQPFVDKLANFRRIRALQQAQQNNGNTEDYVYFVKTTNHKQQIINLSVGNQILSKHTAFICVQKQLIDGRYEQIKKAGTDKVQITTIKQQPPVVYQCCYMLAPMMDSQSAEQFQEQEYAFMMQQCCKEQAAIDVYSKQLVCDEPYEKELECIQFGPAAVQKVQVINPVSKQMDIKDIVKDQLFEGYWTNELIIQEKYGNQVVKIIQNIGNKPVAITLLIAAWIQKNHPEKNYALIVKKARNWLKKQKELFELTSLLEPYLK